MHDVIVTLVHPVSDGGERIREQVGLSFSRVSQQYLIQNAAGGNGGAVTASVDIKANKEI